MKWLPIIALCLNFVGTVMVALSIGANPGGGYQDGQKGERIYLASLIYPRAFRYGLRIIAFGFFVQLAVEFGHLLH